MKIWYSNPFSIEKNFGKAINDFCALIPNDDDWIVIQDGDMMYLQPDWGVTIHKTLEIHGSEYDLFGCYTNRLREGHQLHKGTFNPIQDITLHFEISKMYKGYDVEPIKSIAGLFMAFQKKTWIKVGGFKEKTYAFDSDFCRKVGKIALMKGLYVYHGYRIWSNNPTTDIKHLI